MTREDSRQLVIEAEAPEDGFLLLADTFYPGWTAQVDGRPTPIYRANLSVRGIQLPKGRHEVRFTYDAPGFCARPADHAAGGFDAVAVGVWSCLPGPSGSWPAGSVSAAIT